MAELTNEQLEAMVEEADDFEKKYGRPARMWLEANLLAHTGAVYLETRYGAKERDTTLFFVKIMKLFYKSHPFPPEVFQEGTAITHRHLDAMFRTIFTAGGQNDPDK